jgi:hypothetical protein
MIVEEARIECRRAVWGSSLLEVAEDRRSRDRGCGWRLDDAQGQEGGNRISSSGS